MTVLFPIYGVTYAGNPSSLRVGRVWRSPFLGVVPLALGRTDPHDIGRTEFSRRAAAAVRVLSGGENDRMDVRLLIIEACPNEGTAATLLRRALNDVGLARVPFETEVVTGLEQAKALGFVGSPTFLIDGQDPFGEPGRLPALACRVYRSAAGAAAVPDIGPLRQALKRAADSGR